MVMTKQKNHEEIEQLAREREAVLAGRATLLSAFALLSPAFAMAAGAATDGVVVTAGIALTIAGLKFLADWFVALEGADNARAISAAARRGLDLLLVYTGAHVGWPLGILSATVAGLWFVVRVLTLTRTREFSALPLSRLLL